MPSYCNLQENAKNPPKIYRERRKRTWRYRYIPLSLRSDLFPMRSWCRKNNAHSTYSPKIPPKSITYCQESNLYVLPKVWLSQWSLVNISFWSLPSRRIWDLCLYWWRRDRRGWLKYRTHWVARDPLRERASYKKNLHHDDGGWHKRDHLWAIIVSESTFLNSIHREYIRQSHREWVRGDSLDSRRSCIQYGVYLRA